MFQVRFQPAAIEDLNDAFYYAAQHAPEAAARWLGRFQKALQTLEHNPHRCPLALESKRCSRELREYVFGKRPFVFRAIYTIDDDTVWILRIRRAQRRLLSAEELGQFGA